MIGLMGAAGAGKDTIAEVLTTMGYGRVAFADKVREGLLIFDPYVAMTDNGAELVRLSTVIEEFGWDHAKRYMPEVRRIQQVFATEVVRDRFGADTWTRLGMQEANRVIESGRMPVFTDVRFPEEHTAIRASGGVIWKVERPSAQGIGQTHASEQWYDKMPYDQRFMNDSTIESLQIMVRLYENVRQRRAAEGI